MPCALGACSGTPPRKKRRQQAPEAKDLVMLTNPVEVVRSRVATSHPNGAAPPASLNLMRFDWSCQCWVCISIVTNDVLAPAGKFEWARGSYSYSLWMQLRSAESIQQLRIVKIGWAFGVLGSGSGPPAWPAKSSTCIVKPAGFEISAAAAAKHGVTQALASSDGRPLRAVLGEMLSDLHPLLLSPGKWRVCMYNLEVEACVVESELRRAQLPSAWWARAASRGLCLMDPYLAQWMRGIDDPVSALKSKPFGFESVVARLFVHMGPVRHAERRWFVLQQIRRCAQNAKATT